VKTVKCQEGRRARVLVDHDCADAVVSATHPEMLSDPRRIFFFF
jgi:hypothetical protein